MIQGNFPATRASICRLEHLAAILPLLLACVHAKPQPDGTPVKRLCTPFEVPASPADDQRAHAAWLSYVVRADGTVANVRAANPAPDWLVSAAVRWLEGCRHQPATQAGVPVETVLRVVVPVRPEPPAEEKIIRAVDVESDWLSAIRPTKECTATPSDLSEAPDGLASFEATVHSTGVVDEVVIPPDVPKEMASSLRRWLAVCPFEPPESNGPPLAARVAFQGAFSPAGARVTAVDPDLVRPEIDQCTLGRWPDWHREAVRHGMQGSVRLIWTIAADGRVIEAVTAGDAPPQLADAVRLWAESCTFKPAYRRSTGNPVAIKLTQTITFRR